MCPLRWVLFVVSAAIILWMLLGPNEAETADEPAEAAEVERQRRLKPECSWRFTRSLFTGEFLRDWWMSG